jgi:aspartate 4-decarboxylase
MDAGRAVDLGQLPPHRIEEELVRLARRSSSAGVDGLGSQASWMSTMPRDAFFLLGQFAQDESRRSLDLEEGLAGVPAPDGIAGRADAWLAARAEQPGADFLVEAIHFAVDRFGFEPDRFVHELASSVLGSTCAQAARILPHNEVVARAHLQGTLGGGGSWPAGRLDLIATEGASAALSCLFHTLRTNRLLRPGDRVALGTPIPPSYGEIVRQDESGLATVDIAAHAADNFQYQDPELAKLLDPAVKAFLLVNPGDPTAAAIEPPAMARIVRLAQGRRPDLLVIAHDAHPGFVPGFRSLLAELPRQTVGVCSYDAYFGAAAWQLGLLAIHDDHLLDRRIADLPEADRQELERRYAGLCPEPRRLPFVERLVADRRVTALGCAAGLAPPQQAMMTLFALSELMDLGGAYQAGCIGLLESRCRALADGLGIAVDEMPGHRLPYALVDIGAWMERQLGAEAAARARRQLRPVELAAALARGHGIALLPGDLFGAPPWSLRVPLADLDEAACAGLGQALEAAARGCLAALPAHDGS